MDPDGVWRAPEEWPEDYPPIDGWVRTADGRWAAPGPCEQSVFELGGVALASNPEPESVDSRPSRQAQADRRAMYTVAGVIAGAMLLLAGALVVITQAGAKETAEPATEAPEVIYAAETDADRSRRQREAAETAPLRAREDLEQLAIRDAENEPQQSNTRPFDPDVWVPTDDGCLDLAERVLVDRSATPITWADQLECVPDSGRWTDRYLGTVIARTIDAEVIPLVPPQIAFVSGGGSWSSTTRQAFLTDEQHRAALQVVAAGSGFNPRQQDPSRWRPSAEEVWCAYAVDWISVKLRWGLDVHDAEKSALSEMLDSCDTPASIGADPATVVLSPLAPPVIDLTAGEG